MAGFVNRLTGLLLLFRTLVAIPGDSVVGVRKSKTYKITDVKPKRSISRVH